MSDASNLLDLPRKAPPGSYLDLNSDTNPIALYTLVDLSDSELEDLLRCCHSKYRSHEVDPDVTLAPQPRFIGQALRAVFDSHVELGKAGVESGENGEVYKRDHWSPNYFLVVIHRDWKSKGILIVTLDDEDSEDDILPAYTDKVMIKADQATIMYASLAIGNKVWVDGKEDPDWLIGDGEDTAEDKDGGDGT